LSPTPSTSHKIFIATTAGNGRTELMALIAHQQPIAHLGCDRATGDADVAVRHAARRLPALPGRHAPPAVPVRDRAGRCPPRSGRPRATIALMASLTVMFTVGHPISHALASFGWGDPADSGRGDRHRDHRHRRRTNKDGLRAYAVAYDE
jgi:hypothetical protein